ncbi:MAG: branched-chain-amino-acid transaminase [Chloroflexi bacterium]|nr:branched-chain-amino-acid transaminase [Chloroflexota bacterium]
MAASQIPAESIVYIDGAFYPESQAKISVFDHVVLYGDAVYDTCCAWGGKIFKLDRHMDRLYASARALKLQIPLAQAQLSEVVVETVRRNQLQNAYIKIVATRGVGERPLMSPYHCKPNLIVFAKPYMSLAGDDQELQGIRVKVASWRRIPDECLPSQVKSCNYLNHILMRMEANEAGYDDALELTTQGYVAEAPGYNVFTVKQGRIYTPDEEILYGITRETVFEIAARHQIAVIAGRLTVFDCYVADEVFYSSTAGGIFPVKEIDGRVIGDGRPGPITRLVHGAYQDLLASGTQSTPVYG